MAAVFRTVCQPCQRDSLLRLFHTSSSTLKQRRLKSATELQITRESQGPRTSRSSQSSPKSKKKTHFGLRSAPPPPKEPFSREEPPHPGAVPPEEPPPSISFRRKSERENQLDWRKRRSNWGQEIQTTVEDRRQRQHPGRVWEPERTSTSLGRFRKKYPQSSSPSSALADQARSADRITAPSEKSTDKSLSHFTSPPLIPGILHCLHDVVGRNATPTTIQSLSLQHILTPYSPTPQTDSKPQWRQFLLASETGSGKSIAYLLPVLQSLKQTENSPHSQSTSQSQRRENPRALILAPTHELSRQLSGFAKDLLHEAKLKVVCASQANLRTRSSEASMKGTAREMKMALDADSDSKELDIKPFTPTTRQTDVFVGTPMKILELVKGKGWDRTEEDVIEDQTLPYEEKKRRKWRAGLGRWKAEPEMGLSNVEWVVVDEADVLFDPDFQETTRLLLSEISAARGKPINLSPAPSLSSFTESESETSGSTVDAIDYPFNLILTSATIPNSLSNYLERHHPSMQRLVSPKIHRLPTKLQTEYVDWSGGNKLADIEKRIRQVWSEDSVSPRNPSGSPKLSKILIFCNKGKKVEALSEYLEEKGIKTIWLTGSGSNRLRGSNRHLQGFLKERPGKGIDKDESDEVDEADGEEDNSTDPNNPKMTPHVMITTSLLSRGLDFSPDLKNVFIVDEPRNLIDFLHRAGRSGRAGQRGRVVVFGKYEGRGSGRAREVRKRVAGLGNRN
ncbi:P-loop containing nucleoside triphosphate hydrolase protein [Dendrothele bispora CBS 962.96]|uniref:RNA helicase n=1 Tax=Dendrothele bispora (strain CBS 962.96) TaxID=1314807 RepID=A0A4S8LVF8_DENBC|nr:P-loop containing nucleoside triphosphate hydrolase protein [Dendrothele bispora CBS 962.96]